MKSMKLRLLITLGLIFAANGVTTSSHRAGPAQRSYPLMCRGGENMTVHAHSHGDTNTIFEIRFKKGTYAASEQAVRPGECTWLDRPMLDSEPAIIGGIVRGGSVSSIVRMGGTVEAWIIVGGEKQKQDLKYLIDGVTRGEPFQVHGYALTSRGGPYAYINVTRIGP